MLNMIKRLVREEEGQGMTEYALVLGVIAIGAVTIMVGVSGKVEGLWNTISNQIQSAIDSL